MNTTHTTGPTAGSERIARIESIRVFPVKSCEGIDLNESEITIDGLLWDRNWMVVDRDGEALTQRELPRMALVKTAFRMGALMLRAPGMLPLHLSLDSAEAATTVQLWGESLPAFEMGAVAGQWFSDFLGVDQATLGHFGWYALIPNSTGSVIRPGPALRHQRPSSRMASACW